MFGSILGAASGLFGGGSSEASSSSSSQDKIWGLQSPYLESLFKNAQNLYSQGYQAPGIADFNGTQNQAMADMLNYAETANMQNSVEGIMNNFDVAQNYHADVLNGGQAFNNNINNFINSDLVNNQINTANQAVTDQFNTTMSGIAANTAMGMNTGSTRRAAAEVMAAKEAAKLKSNNITNIQSNAYDNAINQMNFGASSLVNNASQGVNLLNQGYSTVMQPYQTALNIGGMQQDMTQSQYDWLNNSSWDLLGRYQAAIGAPTVLGSSTSTSSSGSAKSNDGFGDLIGDVIGTFF